MKRNKYFLQRCCVVASLIVLGCSCSQVANQPQNQPTQIEIIRDEWGVPHIYVSTGHVSTGADAGRTDSDAEAAGFYGLGYAQAQDRLHKLLGLVLWARGEAGRTGIAGVDGFDYHNKFWRHQAEAEAGWQRLPQQLQRNYRFFTAGVQAYMDDFPKQAPAWAPQLRATDWLTLSRALFWMGYQTTVGLSECFNDAQTMHSIKLVPALTPFADGRKVAGTENASNGMAVNGSKAAGDSLLLADPHSEVGANAAYYEAHMEAGGLKVSGFVLGPMLWQVHNGKLAWTMTTGAPDVIDCYRIRLDSDKPIDEPGSDTVSRDNTVAEIQRRHVSLYQGDQRRDAPVDYISINGVSAPVVARDKEHIYALATPYMHDAGAMDAEIYRMVKAQTVIELKRAMAGNGMLPQNIIAADYQGNIFYVRAGKTPIRASGYDWSKPLDGNDAGAVWTGIHDFDELLQVTNPPQNYLQNNNSAPDTMFTGPMFTDAMLIDPVFAGELKTEMAFRAQNTLPHLFNDTPGRSTPRGLISREFLAGVNTLTAQQLQQHAFDERWYGVAQWQQVLRRALQDYALDWPQHWVTSLLEFGGRADKDSVAALRYYFWMNTLPGLLVDAGLQEFLHNPWDPQHLNQATAQVLLQSLNTAEQKLVSQLNEADSVGDSAGDKTLGDFARMGRGERSEPIGGISILPDYFQKPGAQSCAAQVNPFCSVTLRAYKLGAMQANGSRPVTMGSHAMRLVAFQDQDVEAWSLYAYGQSLQTDSPHAFDQIREFSEKRMKRAWWRREDVIANARSRLVLGLNPQTLNLKPQIFRARRDIK